MYSHSAVRIGPVRLHIREGEPVQAGVLLLSLPDRIVGKMESRNIVFLLSGPAHAPYLCAALWTLRKHWRGPIRVVAWPESIDIAWVIGRDGRLDAEVIPRKPMYRRKNAQFLDKIALFQTLPADKVYLYLDCDVTVNGDVSPIFADAEAHDRQVQGVP